MQALAAESRALKHPLLSSDTDQTLLQDPAKLAAARRQLDGRAVKLVPDERWVAGCSCWPWETPFHAAPAELIRVICDSESAGFTHVYLHMFYTHFTHIYFSPGTLASHCYCRLTWNGNSNGHINNMFTVSIFIPVATLQKSSAACNSCQPPPVM